MWNRSVMLAMSMSVVGCMGAENVSDDPAEAGTVSQDSTSSPEAIRPDAGGFVCKNTGVTVNVVSCVGQIALLPITVNIKNVRVLNNNQLNVLSGDLNNLSVLDGGLLNGNKILNDVELTVLNDFLNKFHINVTRNDIDVCTAIAAVQICK